MSEGFDFWRILAKNPYVLIIKGILFRWYMMIVIPAVMATYYFFEAINKSGYGPKIFCFIQSHMNMLVNVARECSAYFPNIVYFVQCAGSVGLPSCN